MKKFGKILLLFLAIGGLTLTLFLVPVSAGVDPIAQKLQDELGLLDHFYSYNENYMIRKAGDDFVSYDTEEPVIVPAADFEAALHKYFVIDDAMIERIRLVGGSEFYNAATNTYTIDWLGGFGGSLPPRKYLGYVKNGDTYDVYYRHITYGYLRDALPENVDEDAYADSLGWPETIVYNNLEYTGGPDGYYTTLSYDDFGRKYTVEMNGDVVRIISCVDYTQDQQPDKFDDASGEVIYDLPSSGEVVIPENNCFEGNTTVKAYKVESGSILESVAKAMEWVATKYVAYEFTALKDGANVQPNGKLTVTFAIPDGYSLNVSVYYLSSEGNLESVQAIVNDNARTVTAELDHFSTYVLADDDTKPHQHEYSQVVTPPTCKTEGYTTYTCSCGDKYEANKVPKSDHPYKSVVSLPTCTAEGYTAYTCTACGHSYTDNKVDKTDHVMGEWSQSKAPTYTEQGEEKRTCVNCTYFETRQTAVLEVPATTTAQDTTTAPNTTSPTTTNNGETTPQAQGTQPPQTTPVTSLQNTDDGAPMDTRTIVIIALVGAIVAVIVAIVVVLVTSKRKK